MLALYHQLFAELHDCRVEYCIWKNVQELPEALAGKGDIDLYISPASHALFCTTLRAHGFARLISHKATPCVEHYYGFDASSGRFCHLHCYFRIVTGESHIKQYVVPIEDYLADFPSSRNKFGVREMHPTLQYKLNLFRRSIKLSCLPGVLLFFRERQGYRQERMLLEQALCESAAARSTTEASGWLNDIQTSASLRGEIVAGLQNRIRFRNWNRFPALATPVYRYGTILLRLAGKLRRQSKMLPMGISIAVTCTDQHSEAGRNLERQLASWLGQHFHVVTVHDSAIPYLPDTVKPANSAIHNLAGLSSAIGSFWHTFNRHRKIKSALQQTIAGSIVVRFGELPARRTADAPTCQESPQSAMTNFDLPSPAAPFEAKPGVDILIRMSGDSPAGHDKRDIATDAPGTFQPAREAATESVSTQMQISVDECHTDVEETWKCEVWRALLAFQP